MAALESYDDVSSALRCASPAADPALRRVSGIVRVAAAAVAADAATAAAAEAAAQERRGGAARPAAGLRQPRRSASGSLAPVKKAHSETAADPLAAIYISAQQRRAPQPVPEAMAPW